LAPLNQRTNTTAAVPLQQQAFHRLSPANAISMPWPRRRGLACFGWRCGPAPA